MMLEPDESLKAHNARQTWQFFQTWLNGQNNNNKNHYSFGSEPKIW